MDQLFPVIFIVGLIAYMMIKQVGRVTFNLDQKGDTDGFEKYSKFSVAIQNHIRAIKLDIDSTKHIDNPRYILLNKKNEEDTIELLSDFLRKLVFFETLLAKQKTSTEIEGELFGVLSQLDELIKEKFKDGELLAEELKDNLLKEYED